MTAPRHVVSDTDIATAAVEHWPNPDGGYYQAKVMTTIALMESNGDALALLMNVPPSQLAGYVDRGLWGINEGAIRNLVDYDLDPATFIDPDHNAEYAREIWQWRYDRKLAETGSTTQALIYAYNGWTTYRRAKSGLPADAEYAIAWKARWPRAEAAVNEVTP
jgi:hypothetical protein